MRRITITSRSGEQLADGREPDQVLELESNWYFDPAAVNADVLEKTRRTYTCPYKGTCVWVDYVGDEGRIHDVAWVYDDPLPGYETIKGRYGFYGNNRAGTYARVRPT